MSNQLDQYAMTPADWRKVLRQNSRRTFFVIASFFLVYIAIGFLLDVYFYAGTYPDAAPEQLFYALITFQLTPVITFVMLIIAALSLFISYALHDKLIFLGTDYRQITPETAQSVQERQLYNVVEEMKIAAGLHYMPRVFIINADYMNAFASGYSEKSALVAITRGLMQKLNRDELQAVMAHELSHIRHMDIKLTLTASLLANLTLMIIDIVFYNMIFNANRNSESNRSRNSLAGIIFLIRYLLPIINILLLLYLSRRRELMADAGCVELMRANEPLARALLKIQNDHNDNRERYNLEYQQTPHENVRREAYIFDPFQAGIESITSVSDFFSTHPSIEARLTALGFTKKNDR